MKRVSQREEHGFADHQGSAADRRFASEKGLEPRRFPSVSVGAVSRNSHDVREAATGTVRSGPQPEAARFLSRVNVRGPNQCWRWIGPMRRDGYGSFGGTKSAHRASYEFFNGPIPAGALVRHTCDHPWCVNPRHLVAGTHADNRADCVERGRQAKGEQNGRAKLTEDQVREIYRIANLRLPGAVAQLARFHGVSQKAIRLIRDGEKWAHVTQPDVTICADPSGHAAPTAGGAR